MCAKRAYGDNLNVALIDNIHAEFVKAAFDLDTRRMGESASQIALVHDGKVYYMGGY